MTPADAARTILTQLPHAVPPAMLEDYGLALSPAQARRLTREALALGLFWVRSALDLALKAATGAKVFAELRRAIEQEWRGGFGQEADAATFFEEAGTRRAVYDRIMREGAPPMMIATETAGFLVEAGAVPAEDRTKALALLMDIVPVDEIGELISDLDVGEG